MISILKKGIGLFLLFHLFSCYGQIQEPRNGLSDDFDNSPPVYFGMPAQISARDTSPVWSEPGPKLLLTGTVYQRDGRTPVADVLLYYYQTNREGRYVHNPAKKRTMAPNKLGQTHGYIRGWVKTDSNGRYEIYTQRPGAYPNRKDPAHIHLYIKEPNRKSHYYIDDFVFDDDKLLTTERRLKMKNRGGSGILRLVKKDGVLVGERNIMLGLHIPGYSAANIDKFNSGKEIGENIFSFTPKHAWGPDQGSKVCPVCKYGWYQGILYFVGEDPVWEAVKKWLIFLEAESRKREKYLKVYLVYGNEKNFDSEKRHSELAKIGQTLGLEKVALTFVPSFNDLRSSIYQNQINPSAENTFLLYQRSIIIDKYINLKPSSANFAQLTKRLEESINEYFALPKISQKEQQ